MMEGIPSIYWMVLIGTLTGFICFVLYQLAMLLSDSRSVVKNTNETVKEVNKTIQEVNEIVKEVNEIISTVKGTVYLVNDAVLVPVKKISTVLSVVSGISEGLASKRGK